MPNRLEQQFTYAAPGKEFTIGVARHNIGDLVELNPLKAAKVKAKYSQRFGHIPVGGMTQGILLDDPSSITNPEISELTTRAYINTQTQAEYIGALSGDSNRFTIYTPQTLLRGLANNGESALIAPYLNNGNFNGYLETNGLQIPQIEISGMHSEIVHDLKDKGTFHNLAKEAQDPDFAVPHHEVVGVHNVVSKSMELVEFENELYDAVDMPSYKRGVFGRLSFSDGGFGSFNVHTKENGEIILETDDKKKRKPYAKWEDALEDAQAYMLKSVGDKTNQEVVISRSLDLRGVPGLSMFFMDGEVLPLGFNGQILDEQTKACIGTSTYNPDDQYIQERQTEFEHRATEAFKRFVHGHAKRKGIDPKELRGPVNEDVMILGAQERIVQQQIAQKLHNGSFDASLLAKLHKYGQLDQPSDFFLAESNPRRTNLIEAIDEVLLVENLPQTVASMRKVLNNGIRAEDQVPIPTGVNVDNLSDELLETYAPDQREDGLVILRTRPIETPKRGATASIGVILTGEIEQRKNELHTVYERVRSAA